MNGKRREIPVTPPERELQWCYYSPSIFLASSQTDPAPKYFWHSCKMAARNAKALDLDDLTEK